MTAPRLAVGAVIAALLATAPCLAQQPSASAPGDTVLLVLPFAGPNASFRGTNPGAAGGGLRLGTLLGGHLTPRISLNVAFVFDFVTLPWQSASDGATNHDLELESTFSPLVHLPFTAFEAVVGPKLGVFAMAARSTNKGYVYDQRVTGADLGLQVALLARVSPGLALGALGSVDLQHPMRACYQTTSTPRWCSANLDDVIFLSAALAALF